MLKPISLSARILLVTLTAIYLPATYAGSKILATGGVSPIEGGAGGGISPWALITGYGSNSEWGGSAFHTNVSVDDYELNATGLALGWADRVELSMVRQTFDIDALSTDISQDIFSAKVRVTGELLYSTMPQISVGVAHKRNKDFDVPALLGADDDQGTDVYIAASKLWFAALMDRNILVNAAIRRTQANETGLLGFADDTAWVVEGSVGVFLNERWILGYEYRQKPDHLDSVEENDWQHIFLGYFPSRHVSVTAAWVDLNEIAGQDDQRGLYLSLQGHF